MLILLRLRVERRIRKRLRQASRKSAALLRCVRLRERDGLSLRAALRGIATDPAEGWMLRGEAARMLAGADRKAARDLLLTQFFSQSEKVELWATGLALEWLGDPEAVSDLARALHDDNVHRRHAAARALGWIPMRGSRASRALVEALSDMSQPVAVREEAAESLAYDFSNRAVAALISALADPDVRIRFWSVFALGSKKDPRVTAALEQMLSDDAVTPGNWWSVGREALAMLGDERLIRAIQAVRDDPHASPEDVRWAQCYG